MTHRVGAKGQVVIPKALREHADLHPGTEVDFALEGRAVVLAARSATKRLGGRGWPTAKAGGVLKEPAREPRLTRHPR
jgi:AbrB family looped-hinge helix DNA binding protein